jgi:hypothetical protein
MSANRYARWRHRKYRVQRFRPATLAHTQQWHYAEGYKTGYRQGRRDNWSRRCRIIVIACIAVAVVRRKR